MKNNIIKKSFYLLIGIISLINYSCQKVIDVDLNKTDPKPVFEFILTNDSTKQDTCFITQTTSYFNSQKPTPIQGAKVIVKKDDGTQETLKEVFPGKYITQFLVRREMHSYSMEATLPNGQKYNSTASYLYPVQDIDSLKAKYEKANGFFEAGYYIYFYGKDNGKQRNFYRFDLWQNDTMVTRDADKWLIGDDKFLSNSGYFSGLRAPFAFRKGDSVFCQLSSMPQEEYDYLMQLQAQLNSDGGVFSPPPANPKTNISNGGLGFFAANGIRSKGVRIK